MRHKFKCVLFVPIFLRYVKIYFDVTITLIITITIAVFLDRIMVKVDDYSVRCKPNKINST